MRPITSSNAVGRFWKRSLVASGPAAAPSGPGTFTLFGQPANPATITTDAASYTMGVQFSLSRAGTLAAVWFNSPAGAVVLPGSILLYAVTGQVQLANQVASWSGAVASGWVRAPFNSPPALSAGVNYKACIFINNTSVQNFYSSTSHYWDTGAGQNGITSGPLSAPNNAGGNGGQDTFTQSGTIAYPATSFNATNYWIDAEVVA